MRRHLCTLVLALATIAAVQPAQANWFARLWAHIRYETLSNNLWPDAFLPADRAAARAPFGVMVANGWRLQNTLADHHFDADGELSEAGQLKVFAILTDSPLEHRTAFVLQSTDPETTAARIEAVHQAAEELAALGALNDVVQTSIAPRGTPAGYVDDVQRRWNSTTPDPRIPERERPAND